MDEIQVTESTPELSDLSTDELTLDSTQSVETGTETAEETTTETGEESKEDGSTETDKETEADPSKDEPAIQGTKLSAAAKATLDNIRKENPKLAAELKSALFEREAIRAEMPGGVKEVKEIKTKLEAVGGFEGITQLQTEVKDWQALDQRFTAGDPAFVEEIAAASPEAFTKLAPAVFSKFNEVSPDGFSKYIAGIFQNDMASAGLYNTLDRLSDFLPTDNPKAVELWNKITSYLGRIDGLAKQQVKQVETKAAQKQNPSFDEERQQFEKQKDEFTRNQWVEAVNSPRLQIFNDSWAKATKDLKLTTEQAAAIKERYGIKIANALKSVPDLQKTAEAYYKAGDKEGYVRYMKSVFSNHIPKAIEAAMSGIGVAKKPGPRPGTAATPRPQLAASNGVTVLPTAPKSHDVDWLRTDRTMYSKGQAILKDGKKVQFKR